MIKVLIITYYFPPGSGSGVQRWMYFTRFLPKYGIEPYIITVDPDKASYRFIDAELNKKVEGAKVFRTSTREILSVYSQFMGGDRKSNIPQGFAGEDRPGIMQKIFRFIRGNFFLPDARRGWNRFAFEKAVEIISNERIDLVITTGPPHSTHLTGLRLKKKFNIKWIADFRDPWTEVYYNNMLYKTFPAKMIDERMEKSVLKVADVVLTVGPGMQRLLGKKIDEKMREKVKYIYNGYDGDLFRQLERKPADYFCISHSGILSENQPIDSFLEALEVFIQRHPSAINNLRIQFVGNVSPSIIKSVERVVGAERLLQTGYVSHAEAVQHMINADLLINSFAVSSDSSILVSGKLMEYIATGNPILGLGDPSGDAADLLRGHNHSQIFDRSDIQGISFFIERIYLQWQKGESSPSIGASYSQFSRKASTEVLSKIIKDLI